MIAVPPPSLCGYLRAGVRSTRLRLARFIGDETPAATTSPRVRAGSLAPRSTPALLHAPADRSKAASSDARSALQSP
jgi:hypothetical protein